jgi:transcriptional regulator with XRE-family HTH domain
MPIRAHLPPDAEERADSRRMLLLQTEGRIAGGSEANVTIHNISAAGLLLETGLDVAFGERLELELPEAGAVTAVVVWRSESLYGCAFEESLGAAALAAAELRASAPSAATAAPSSVAGMGDTLGTAFGSKLNRLRRERGLTLADVASALGVSKPTVWAWEKGKARPVPERLEAIAAALDVSLEELEEAGHATAETNAFIADCRAKIAATLRISPSAVRIMIEL